MVSPRCRTADRPSGSGPTMNRFTWVGIAVFPFISRFWIDLWWVWGGKSVGVWTFDAHRRPGSDRCPSSPLCVRHPATNLGATEMVIGHVTGLGHHGSKRENRFCLILTLVNAAKRRAAFRGQRLPEWNRVCIGGDEQARGVRSVAPRVIDPADDRRVTRVHQHLVDVGDEVDLATHARAAVERVRAV